MIPVTSIEISSASVETQDTNGNTNILLIPTIDTYTNNDGQRRSRQIAVSDVKTILADHTPTVHPTSKPDNVLNSNEELSDIPFLGEDHSFPPEDSTDPKPRAKRPGVSSHHVPNQQTAPTMYLQDFPMREWTKHRDQFLAEFMRLEGQGNDQSAVGCPHCLQPDVDAVYRCTSCSSPYLVCASCILANHHLNGLHILEVSSIYLPSSSGVDMVIRVVLERISFCSSDPSRFRLPFPVGSCTKSKM
jgi:hypothetical protein